MLVTVFYTIPELSRSNNNKIMILTPTQTRTNCFIPTSIHVKLNATNLNMRCLNSAKLLIFIIHFIPVCVLYVKEKCCRWDGFKCLFPFQKKVHGSMSHISKWCHLPTAKRQWAYCKAKNEFSLLRGSSRPSMVKLLYKLWFVWHTHRTAMSFL